MALIELDAGSHDNIVNLVTSWAAYVDGDTVILVGVYSPRPNPPIAPAHVNATLQFRMTKDVARTLVRQLAPWLPLTPLKED